MHLSWKNLVQKGIKVAVLTQMMVAIQRYTASEALRLVKRLMDLEMVPSSILMPTSLCYGAIFDSQ